MSLDVAGLGFVDTAAGHRVVTADHYNADPTSHYGQITCSCGAMLSFSLTKETKASTRGLRYWKEHLIGAAADPSEKLLLGTIRTSRTRKSVFLMPVTNLTVRSYLHTSQIVRMFQAQADRCRLNFVIVMETAYEKGATKRSLVSSHGTREEAITKARTLLSKEDVSGREVTFVDFGSRVEAPTRLSVFTDALTRADEAKDIASIQESLDEIKELLAASRLLAQKKDELVERLNRILTRPRVRV